MSRIVLLHLLDTQVDLLTLAREQKPAENVVVVHPQEDSLIRRLANISEVTSLSTPPEATIDDLVVTSNPPESPDLAAWKIKGARIISPEQFLRGSVPESKQESPSAPAAPTKPQPVEEPKERFQPLPATSETGDNVLEALTTPEASLQFLLRQSLGDNAKATLWWDGQVGLWTPWAGYLDGQEQQETPPQGITWATDWGTFVLSGEKVLKADWNHLALKRISEDMVLRDLMMFTKQINHQPVLRNNPNKDHLGEWLEAAAMVLKPQTATAWYKEENRWNLESAYGPGIVFSGSLKIDDALLKSSFGEPSTWIPSNWPGDVRIYWQFQDNDHRWPLYLKRLQHLESLE